MTKYISVKSVSDAKRDSGNTRDSRDSRNTRDSRDNKRDNRDNKRDSKRPSAIPATASASKINLNDERSFPSLGSK